MTATRPDPAFEVRFDRRAQTLVAAPAGELDIATAPQLARAIAEQASYERLVIDLRRLSFMDSTGLRLLVAEAERAAQGGWELRIVRGRAEVHRILRLTRLDEQLPVADADELGL